MQGFDVLLQAVLLQASHDFAARLAAMIAAIDDNALMRDELRQDLGKLGIEGLLGIERQQQGARQTIAQPIATRSGIEPQCGAVFR